MTTPKIADTTRKERSTAELIFCNITILTPFLLGLFKQIIRYYHRNDWLLFLNLE